MANNPIGIYLLNIVAVAFFLTPTMSFAIDDPKARAIMQRVDARNDGDNQSAEMQMILIDRHGKQRIRRLAVFRRDHRKDTYRMLFFIYPADVKDTALLIYDYDNSETDDDQWLYLPALKKIKRIASSDKSGSFMGSDLNYSDMTSLDLEDYDFYFYERGKTSKVRGKKVWVIWAIPRTKQTIDETGYNKSIYFVRPDIDMVVRAIHWEHTGRYLKYVDIRKIVKIDGIMVATHTHVIRKKGKSTHHQTVLTLSNVHFNQDLDADLFSVKRLEKGL